MADSPLRAMRFGVVGDNGTLSDTTGQSSGVDDRLLQLHANVCKTQRPFSKQRKCAESVVLPTVPMDGGAKCAPLYSAANIV